MANLYVQAEPSTDLNRNTEWFTYPGVWTIYIFILFFAWLLVLSIFGCSPGMAWTTVNLSHAVLTYQFFHWKKGTPFTDDQGIYNRLTWWEQIDSGKQLTRNRKFLTLVPVVLGSFRASSCQVTNGNARKSGICFVSPTATIVSGDRKLEDSFAAFPMNPIQALKGCFDVGEDDVAAVSPTAGDENLSDSEQHGAMKPSLKSEDQAELNDAQHLEQRKSLLQATINGPKKYSSGSRQPDNLLSFKKEYTQAGFRIERSYSGPLQGRQKNNTNSYSEDALEEAVVQRKGRFKVTSADPKSLPDGISEDGT